jgi:hypothetical protein
VEWERPLYDIAIKQNVTMEKIALKYNQGYFYNRDIRKEVAKFNLPSLALIRELYGYNTAVAYLMIQLQSLNEFCGKRISMTEQQMECIADIILQEYPHVTLPRLLAFFHFFKAGRYGLFYGEIDPMKITSSLHEWFNKDMHKIIKDYKDSANVN